MANSSYENLVERYINGEMTYAEEQQFFLHVGINDELRRMLKAYSIVDDSIMKEKEASLRGHGRVRESLTTTLHMAVATEYVVQEQDRRNRFAPVAHWGLPALLLIAAFGSLLVGILGSSGFDDALITARLGGPGDGREGIAAVPTDASDASRFRDASSTHDVAANTASMGIDGNRFVEAGSANARLTPAAYTPRDSRANGRGSYNDVAATSQRNTPPANVIVASQDQTTHPNVRDGDADGANPRGVIEQAPRRQSTRVNIKVDSALRVQGGSKEIELPVTIDWQE